MPSPTPFIALRDSDRQRRFLSYHIQRNIYLPLWASDIQVSLPRKQNRHEDERRVPHLLTPQSVERGKVGLRNSGTAEVAKFSRLSAQMVELSLQRAQGDATLPDPFPAKLNAISSPLHDTPPAKPNAVSSSLPWPTTSAPPPPQPREAPRESKVPDYWKEVRSNLDNWLAGARVSGSAAVRNLREHAKSVQKKFAVPNLKSRYGTASGFWTSMGVAALSVVLLVGVISGVRHYVSSPDTPQPRGPNASQVIPAMQDISQPHRGSIVHTNGAAAMYHPARSSAAAKHVAAKPSPGEPGIRKIRRKNKEDDYVAKDTYVYYGPKGKPAR